MKSTALRLRLELVPSTSWGENLRRILPKGAWAKISRDVRNAAKHTCCYCGSEASPPKWNMHCHEVWEFDDALRVQTLRRLECICPTCHMVHHYGKAGIDGTDMRKLDEHAIKVNGCSAAVWRRHVQDSFRTWERRSAMEWQLGFVSIPPVKIPALKISDLTKER